MFNITENTWLISDTHFGHKNIVKYCDRPMEHNGLMVNSWTKLVQPEDTILHLGDLAVWYGDEESYWLEIAKSMPGKKFMLRGNHDKLKDKVYAELGFTMTPEFVQEIKGQRVLFSHYPDELRTSEWDINVHGHIHNNPLEPRLAKTGRRYKNISVELMDYKPIRAKELLTFA